MQVANAFKGLGSLAFAGNALVDLILSANGMQPWGITITNTIVGGVAVAGGVPGLMLGAGYWMTMQPVYGIGPMPIPPSVTMPDATRFIVPPIYRK